MGPDFDFWEQNDSTQVFYKKLSALCHDLFKQPNGRSRSGLSVLDFGVGPGFFLKSFLEGDGKTVIDSVVGADVAKEVLEYMEDKVTEYGIKDKVTPLLMEKEDGSDLKSYEGAFDLAICSLVLGHVRANFVEPAVKNLADSVKQNGFVVIAEFDNIGAHHEGHDPEKNKFVSDGGHAHTSVTKEELEKYLTDAGLKMMPEKYTDFALIPIKEPQKGFVVVAKRE